ncbi:MAG: hypothetical protein ACLQSR_04515 [Limisphaerales bacterium]
MFTKRCRFPLNSAAIIGGGCLRSCQTTPPTVSNITKKPKHNFPHASAVGASHFLARQVAPGGSNHNDLYRHMNLAFTPVTAFEDILWPCEMGIFWGFAKEHVRGDP